MALFWFISQQQKFIFSHDMTSLASLTNATTSVLRFSCSILDFLPRCGCFMKNGFFFRICQRQYSNGNSVSSTVQFYRKNLFMLQLMPTSVDTTIDALAVLFFYLISPWKIFISSQDMAFLTPLTSVPTGLSWFSSSKCWLLVSIRMFRARSIQSGGTRKFKRFSQ